MFKGRMGASSGFKHPMDQCSSQLEVLGKW